MKRVTAPSSDDFAGLAVHLLAVISPVLALLVVLRLRALMMFDSISGWCSETGGVHSIAFHACVLCSLAAFVAVLAALALVNLGLRVRPFLQARSARR
jgi:hypothetical protein